MERGAPCTASLDRLVARSGVNGNPVSRATILPVQQPLTSFESRLFDSIFGK
jgi:hypothetical protein